MKPKIFEFIDFDRISGLLEGFNKTTGYVTAILDLEGNILSKSGWRRICTDFHRANRTTLERCVYSDTLHNNTYYTNEKFTIYRCLNGLYDVVTPLIIKGEHIANIYTGQFLLEEPNIAVFTDQAREFGFDEKDYLQSLREVPIVKREDVIHISNFLLEITNLIVELTSDKMEQQQISYHDYLTGLHNRRYFEKSLRKLNKKEFLPLTIVMSDINGLKLINDAFGHKIGDRLLKSAAKVLMECCRTDDTVARIGGDEFAILMPKTTLKEAEKIIATIHKKSKKIKVETLELSIAFGYATKSNVSEDVFTIQRQAEDQMYRVKLLEIPSMRSGAIETILNTLNEKDKQSEQHSRIVSTISEKLARANKMDNHEINEIKMAGLLHDIGKIVIPIQILSKNGKLTIDEYHQMQSHCEIGFRILNSTQDLRKIANIVLHHHEKFDGTGYPRGIIGTNIPIQSRIISIADAYDAMTSERSYRKTMTKQEALAEILRCSGTQFDPELVVVFHKNFEEITRI